MSNFQPIKGTVDWMLAGQDEPISDWQLQILYKIIEKAEGNIKKLMSEGDKMKFWEAVKEVTEDPTKEFFLESGSRVFTLKVSEGGYFYLDCVSMDGGKDISRAAGGQFNGNLLISWDWELVKTPVPWQEALEKWTNGYVVKCILPKETVTLNIEKSNSLMNSAGRSLGLEHFVLGKWYVED